MRQMEQNAVSKPLSALVLGLLAGFWACVATAELLDGDLGQWLKQQVAPALIQQVGQHPRFAGSTVELVALDGQQPSRDSNALVAAINDYLRHRLLEQSQARVAWSGPRQNCRVPEQHPYLLGVAVTGSNARVSVSIGALDVTEGVWIPGVSYRWRGSLTAAERRALRAVEPAAATGSLGRPLALANAEAVAVELARQLRCAQRAVLDGAAYFVAAESPALQRLAPLLAAELSRTARIDWVSEPAAADWSLSLRATERGGEVTELSLRASAGERHQRLASVHVLGLSSSPSMTEPVADAADNTVPQPTPGPIAERSSNEWLPDEAFPAQLLAPLTSLALPGGDSECQARGPEQACLLVETELLEPAYVFSFRSESGQVEPNQCRPPFKPRPPGKRRYRLVLENEQSVGFYVIATQDAAAAKALRKLFAQTGLSCDQRRSFQAEQWLARLDAIISRASLVDWQVLGLSGDAALAVARR